MMNRVNTMRALLVAMPGMDEEAQRKAATVAGATVFYSANEPAAWMHALRSGQAGWVWRLSWLAPNAAKDRPAPIIEYARIISDLSMRIGAGAVMYQGDGNVCSDDRKAWSQAVVVGAAQVRAGRRVTVDQYRIRGAAGARINQERAAINLLRTSHQSRVGMIRGMWLDTTLPNRAARADAINAQLQAEGLAKLGSWQTIWRALKQLDD